MNPQYGAWFSITIIGKDAEASLDKWVAIDFVPVVGMRITFDQSYDDFGDFVESVTAAVEDGETTFYVNLCTSRMHDLDDGEDFFYECDCEPGDECCHLDLEPRLTRGWELRGEIRRGADRYHHDIPGIWPDEAIVSQTATTEAP